jgi:NOL1/NOP2/fmu family ribosome biogenesis protein
MGLSAEQVRLRLDLAADGPEVLAYLKGHPLPSSGEDGWLMITVGGHSLGWGKRVQGTVKNHYPKGQRWH